MPVHPVRRLRHISQALSIRIDRARSEALLFNDRAAMVPMTADTVEVLRNELDAVIGALEQGDAEVARVLESVDREIESLRSDPAVAAILGGGL